MATNLDRTTVFTAPQQKEQSKIRIQKNLGRVLTHFLLIALSLVFLFPFYYMVIQSVMTPRELFSVRPVWFPNQFRYENFVELFRAVPFARIAANSVFIAVVGTLSNLFFCSLAGFTFGKYRFPGKQPLFFIMLATMMIPYQATLIPTYLLMANVLNWLDTYQSVIALRIVGAFGIFYITQYISSALPDELIDAATIDGCGFFQVYWSIALPLMLPALTVLGLLSFVWSWNDFLWPLLMLSVPTMQTIPVNLSSLVDKTGTAESLWSLLMAGTAVGTFPLVVLFLFCQRFFVAGLLSGAVKGQ